MEYTLKFEDTKKDKLVRFFGSIVIGFIIPTVLLPHSCPTFSKTWFLGIVVSTVLAGLIWEGNFRILFYLHKKFPWTENAKKRLIFQILLTQTFSVLVVVVGQLIALKYVLKVPIDLNELPQVVGITMIIVFMITAIYESVFFLLSWKHTITQAEQYKREKSEAQFTALKNQINPHFLFNSLNTLSAIIEEDTQKAGKFVENLSNVYRYILQNGKEDITSVKTEIEIVNEYFFLLKTRFENGIDLEIILDEKTLSSSIPPLTIQILIENAVKHNIVDVDRPLKIDIYTEDDFIIVKNNLNKKSISDNKSTKTGISHIKNRYEFLSPTPIIVDIDEQNFIVKLPIITYDA